MSYPKQEDLKQLLDYDPASGQLTWKERPLEMFSRKQDWLRFNRRYAGQPAFTAVNHWGYLVGGIHNKIYRAHRVIWALVHGNNPDQVDHIDGDKLNNSLANLREVTGQENQQNMKRSKSNQSGVTGVCWDNTKQLWKATIGVDCKTVNLGRFPTKEEAIAVRLAAEKEYRFHENHGR